MLVVRQNYKTGKIRVAHGGKTWRVDAVHTVAARGGQRLIRGFNVNGPEGQETEEQIFSIVV